MITKGAASFELFLKLAPRSPEIAPDELAPRSSPPPPSRQADLFNHDVCFAPQAAQQLSTAYTLLGRAPFAKLAKLHAALRRGG